MRQVEINGKNINFPKINKNWAKGGISPVAYGKHCNKIWDIFVEVYSEEERNVSLLDGTYPLKYNSIKNIYFDME